MTSYLYINVSDMNTTSSAKVLNLAASRDVSLLPQDLSNYSLSVERFLLEKAIIPVFQHKGDLKVKILKNGQIMSNTENTQSVSLSSDSNKFIYNINDLVVAINSAITAASVSQSLPGGDIPVLSIDHTTGKASLSYSAIFRDGYKFEFSSDLYKIFSSFVYTVGPDIVSPLYELVLEGTSMTTASQVNTNPINRVVLETVSIPIFSEYVGSGKDSEKILTDFSFSSSYIQESLTNIRYSSQQRYRRHQLGNSSGWRKNDVSFFMVTYDGDKVPITIYPGGRVDCKLFIEKNHI